MPVASLRLLRSQQERTGSVYTGPGAFCPFFGGLVSEKF